MLAALNLCNEATALPLPPAQPPIELPDQNRGDTRPTFLHPAGKHVRRPRSKPRSKPCATGSRSRSDATRPSAVVPCCCRSASSAKKVCG